MKKNKHMSGNKIILSKSAIEKKKGVVVLPLKKWEKMEKERLELQMAFEAILAGEIALREGKTRPSKELFKELCQD